MRLPKHLINIIIVIVIIFITFHSWLNLNELPNRGDKDNPNISSTDLVPYNAVNAYITRDSILNKHDLTPLWNPFLLSGTPFFIKPQVTVYYPQTIFLILSPNTWLGIKLSIIFHFILAGISMYFLIVYLKLDKKIALAASIIFMTNPLIMGEINSGHINILYPYSIVPLIILFTLKAFNRKNWLKYSIITGILFALQVHSGGQSVFLFTSIIFAYILFFNIFGINVKSRILKIFLIGITVMVVLLGLTAIKVLPSSEFIDISSRQQSFSYERSTGGGIPLFNLIFNSPIGLLAILLAIPSLFYYKKKKFLLFFTLMIVSLLILTASPFYYLLWKYLPFLDRQKGLGKAAFLLVTSISILSAYGMAYISTRFKKFKAFKSITVYTQYFFVVLVIGNFLFFGVHLEPTSSIKEQIENNPILNFISNQSGKYRFQNFETNGIDWGIGHVSVPLGLEDVYGYDNIWSPEYLPVYLSVANSKRAKLFGILNMKYLTSRQPINISGFNFVKKFDDCGFDKNGFPLCQPLKSGGPYLYENELFLPRAYLVNNSILIVGNKENSLQTNYALMLNNNFDPSNTVIVIGKQKISNYDLRSLKKFNSIILTSGSLDNGDLSILNNYVNSGGKLFPDITKGKQSISGGEIDILLKNFKGSYNNIKKLEITEKTYDELYLNSENNQGFLVLSEKYSIFPGWNAVDDNGNKKEIFRVNGIISGVYLDGSEKLIKFAYNPPGFLKGMIISSFTLIIILGYFVYIFVKRKVSKNQNKSSV